MNRLMCSRLTVRATRPVVGVSSHSSCVSSMALRPARTCGAGTVQPCRPGSAGVNVTIPRDTSTVP